MGSGVADFHAIHSVGSSVLTYLRNAYPDNLPSCEFHLISSGELAEDKDLGTALSLYLYRIGVNEHLRNRGPAHGPSDARGPLSLDLHYLLTVWAKSASEEQVILGWALRQLHTIPVLDVSSLSAEGGWHPGDVVHLIPAEISNEDMMRIWDAVIPSYRLSFPYIARVVLIDPERMEEGRPVVAARFGFTDREARP
jgi:Pvc16 N-terminal domain